MPETASGLSFVVISPLLGGALAVLTAALGLHTLQSITQICAGNFPGTDCKDKLGGARDLVPPEFGHGGC